MATSETEDKLLDGVDPKKREFIGKLVRTGAFVAPVIASFSMASVSNAEAAPVNGSPI